MTEPSSPDEPTPPERQRSMRDNWWWSGGLWTVAGFAIAAYQWDSITGKAEGFWGNWVMAAIGAGICLTGLWRLWRDWQVEKVRRAEPSAD